MKRIFILILVLLCAQNAQYSLAAARKEVPNPEGGYVGTLPNVTEGFQKSQPATAKPMFDSVDGFNDRVQIKPAPRNNPAFVNIILKKDRTSQYINDINYVIPIIEKIEKIIETKGDIQKFSAEAYFLKENVEYLRDKYQNKSEANYISFKRLMQLNMQIQSISLLRTEGEAYSPYLSYTQNGYIFSPNNINQQLEYLDKEIETTLIILKEAN